MKQAAILSYFRQLALRLTRAAAFPQLDWQGLRNIEHVRRAGLENLRVNSLDRSQDLLALNFLAIAFADPFQTLTLHVMIFAVVIRLLEFGRGFVSIEGSGFKLADG